MNEKEQQKSGGKKTKKITINLPLEYMKILEEYAKTKDESVNMYIRNMIIDASKPKYKLDKVLQNFEEKIPDEISYKVEKKGE